MAEVVSASVLKLSAKRMVCPRAVLLNNTCVSAVTALLNVAPALCIKVKMRSDVVWPTAPVTLTTPALPALKVSDWVLTTVPFTAPPIFKAPPAVLSATSSTKVKAVPLSPKVNAVPVVLNVPPKLMLLGAVAVMPAVKLRLSLAKRPNFKAPVFAKFVTLTPVMLVLAPNNSNS